MVSVKQHLTVPQVRINVIQIMIIHQHEQQKIVIGLNNKLGEQVLHVNNKVLHDQTIVVMEYSRKAEEKNVTLDQKIMVFETMRVH